jgi:outer membrane usher protein
VLSQAFYSSPTLLAEGLTQFSFSAGAVRENYILSSFDYGSLLASASIRRGLTNELTLEGHAEYLDGEARAAGAQLAGLLGDIGVGTVTLAAGGDDENSGWMAGLGFERHGGRGSAGFAVYRASDGFRRASDPELDQFRMRARGIVQGSWSFGAVGTTMLAYAHTGYQDNTHNNTYTLNHSAQIGFGSLTFSLSHTTGVVKQTQGFLTFSMQLEGRRSMETSAEALRGETEDRSQVRAAFAQTAPVGIGHGWRASASTNGDYDAWWLQRFNGAELEVRAASYSGSEGESATVRGGATLLGGMLRASRRIDSSFAVVDVAGVADVPVYVENHLVARTDARGRAMLPNLSSYDINRISIQPQDLPLNTTIDSRQMEIRPAYRSGVLAKFPVARTSPGTFNLFREDGQPVPAGSTVRFNGGTFKVAMEGFTYLTNLDRGKDGSAEWEGGRCTFSIEPPAGDDPMPDLGRVLCASTSGPRP